MSYGSRYFEDLFRDRMRIDDVIDLLLNEKNHFELTDLDLVNKDSNKARD